MICFWILGVLLILFVMLCLLRLGIQMVFDGNQATASIRIGPARIQIVPARGQKKQKKQKKQPVKKKREQSPVERVKALPRPTLADIRSAYTALWPPMRRALQRTRRGIRIHPLRCSVILGGKDNPADTAQLYGSVNAAVWTGMPVLEQLLVISDPQIHLDVDFDQEQTSWSGSFGASVRVGTLLAIGCTVGIPALQWLLRFLRESKKREKALKRDQSKKNEKVPAV